jgi:hypothetical protein
MALLSIINMALAAMRVDCTWLFLSSTLPRAASGTV